MVTLQLNPSARQLRQFAAALLVVLATTLWLKAPLATSTPLYLWGSAALAGWGLVGLFLPRLLLPVYIVLTITTFPIGWCVSFVVAFVMFFGVITPLAVISRWCGRDLLRNHKPAAIGSYWSVKNQNLSDSYYFRQ